MVQLSMKSVYLCNMKCGIIVFPGSNCDQDAYYVMNNIYGIETVYLWHKDPDLKNCDFIILPGGFSYGDYLRTGAVARFSPVMESLIGFANNGGFVFGICNGFQVLCEAHLLPGVLLRNESQKFICKNIYIKAQTQDSLITTEVPVHKALKIPIAHAEGRYFCDDATLKNLRDNDQVVFRYCDENGTIIPHANPNGSIDNIAGICNISRNVFGMMPHPERASDDILGNTDGRYIFDSIAAAVEKNLAAK
jgi:phosphoribosylformylglycinamidine synthase subunit PurQ / glutaminase